MVSKCYTHDVSLRRAACITLSRSNRDRVKNPAMDDLLGIKIKDFDKNLLFCRHRIHVLTAPASM